MAIFQRLLLIAILAGLVTGLLTTLAHQALTVPLILQAEVYETHAVHDHAQPPAWQPAAGWQRALFTAFSDVMMAIGFALLLGAVWAWRGAPPGLPQALVWGLAGYVSFVLAPSLGLPATLPGLDAGPLVARQMWWAASAGATAGGLGLLAFGRALPWRMAGLALLASPHLLGAPQIIAASTPLPAGLLADFGRAVLAAGLVFWLVLAVSTAHFFQREARRAA